MTYESLYFELILLEVIAQLKWSVYESLNVGEKCSDATL